VGNRAGSTPAPGTKKLLEKGLFSFRSRVKLFCLTAPGTKKLFEKGAFFIYILNNKKSPLVSEEAFIIFR
jgi:hypothetical protein